MRKVPLVEGEYYHIFNRGTDKRLVFQQEGDFQRFLKSMKEFNIVKPIGSIYENSFRKNKNKKSDPLVEFLAYCLNPNHYHFILKQVSKDGIQKFMQRLGNGYTKYFNEKYKRSGVLFQGRFKSVHIESDEQLFYMNTYVNFNYLVHKLGHWMSKSSWNEYVGKISQDDKLCNISMIKDRIGNIKKYQTLATETVEEISRKRGLEKINLE
ncbi:MAG: transposase [bacterium]